MKVPGMQDAPSGGVFEGRRMVEEVVVGESVMVLDNILVGEDVVVYAASPEEGAAVPELEARN